LRAAADAPTDTDAGVAVPVVGVAVSHAALLDALQLTDAGLDARATDCDGAVAPTVAVKLSVAGLTVNVGVALTVKVTLTWTAGPAEGVMVTMPL
jgi:hypothetical protein